MNWKLALCLSSFIFNYVYALPKTKHKESCSSSLSTSSSSSSSSSDQPAAKGKRNIRHSRNFKKGTTSERDSSDSDEDSDLHEKKLLQGNVKSPRKLAAGDIFTPQEMLPIATKLLRKVDEPGSGKGFVSSTKYPEELADKLFEAFFMTTQRIVTLKDNDISGLDALQALALSGEVAEEPKEEEEKEEETASLPAVYLRGQFVKINNKPKESKYSLVTKTVGRKPNEAERRGIPLAKKLQKLRHLIVNKRRKNEKKGAKNGDNDNKDVRQEKANKSYKRKEQPTKRSQKDAAKCRWRYVCENATDLDSCRLHTDCAKKNSKVSLDDIPVKHKQDEHTLAIKQFRKMLGLSIVDEEVEKILESRNIHLNPVNRDAIVKVESLSEYFNNIVAMNNFETTTDKSSGMYTESNLEEDEDGEEEGKLQKLSKKKPAKDHSANVLE